MNDQRLCTLRDLAQRFRRFGLSMAWLRREARAGRIPSFRAGNRLLFDPDAVEAALVQRARCQFLTVDPEDLLDYVDAALLQRARRQDAGGRGQSDAT